MCLYVATDHLKDGKEAPSFYSDGKLADYYVPAIAVADIVVFKGLSGNLSPFTDFRYRANREYRRIMRGEDGSAQRVGPGLHSFVTFYGAKDCMFSNRVVLCIIPKGAHLFKGKHGDLVSDRLITGDLKSVTISDWEYEAKKLLQSRRKSQARK